MNKLALVGCLVSAIAFAQQQQQQQMGKQMEQMGWTPRKVTKEDRKGIESTMEAMHKAWMSGDINAAMAHVNFPIFMMTDDKEGNVMTMMVNADAYRKMMDPMVKSMMENKEMMESMRKMPKPKSDMFFLTDTMAVVTSRGQMPMGRQRVETRSAMIMINEGGKWMVKGEMQGGWGDSTRQIMGQGGSGMEQQPHQQPPPRQQQQPMQRK